MQRSDVFNEHKPSACSDPSFSLPHTSSKMGVFCSLRTEKACLRDHRLIRLPITHGLRDCTWAAVLFLSRRIVIARAQRRLFVLRSLYKNKRRTMIQTSADIASLTFRTNSKEPLPGISPIMSAHDSNSIKRKDTVSRTNLSFPWSPLTPFSCNRNLKNYRFR